MAWGKINITGGSDNGFPLFEYTGAYSLIDDGNKNRRIKFLTSGTLVMSDSVTIDVFCVGGGGGGRTRGGISDDTHGGGGAGGYTDLAVVSLTAGVEYQIIIGAGGAANVDGGATTAFAHTANGGTTGASGGTYGGNGGSGGGCASNLGGSNGANSLGASATQGLGQGTTTREFGDADGTLYATGGAHYSTHASHHERQDGIAGTSGFLTTRNGVVNTGAGGGGGLESTYPGGSGGSGIVIIRNHRAA